LSQEFSDLVFAEQSASLKICGDKWVPFINPDDDRMGICFALTESIFLSQGYKISKKILPSARTKKYVLEFKQDAACQFWYTKERAEVLLYSEPYLFNTVHFFVRHDSKIKYDTLENLKGLTIGVIKDYYNGKEFDEADYFLIFCHQKAVLKSRAKEEEMKRSYQKKIRTQIGIFFLGLSFFCGLQLNLVYANECKRLKVSGAYNWLPVAYKHPETNEPVGIAYDVVRIIGKELNIPVEINIKLPWGRAISYLKDGRLDIIAGDYWNEEDSRYYQYSIPFMKNELRAFVLKGKEFTFNRLEDLIGRKGARPLNANYGKEFEAFAEKYLVFFEVGTTRQFLRMLEVGRTDYIMLDHWDGLLNAAQHGMEDKIIALPYAVNTHDVYLTISRKSPCINIVSEINKILKFLIDDGTIEQLTNNYLKRKYIH